ncbi:MAG: hypothetical protein IID16_12515 [Candidatus Marinimicrobia bacterium]|nr:hypothetical protein [Candidatus Neomarinimicrobiota bacterium]
MENYLLKHSQELSEKYPGKYVAIVDDKLVAIDNSALNAFKKVKVEFPDKEVCISYIPTEEETITLL